MVNCNLKFGDIIWVVFPEQKINNPVINNEITGHEQIGKRPAVCLFNPYDLGKPRYELIIVAPITSKKDQHFIQSPLLYPFIKSDPKGLKCDSYILLDQIRSIDIRRISNHDSGTLNQLQLEFLKISMKKIFFK